MGGGRKAHASTAVAQREGAEESEEKGAAQHTPRTIHRTCHTSQPSRPPFQSFQFGFLLGLLREFFAPSGTCAAETGILLRGHNVAIVKRFTAVLPKIPHSNTVRSRYKRIVYKRIWVASLPFQSVWATFSSY